MKDLAIVILEVLNEPCRLTNTQKQDHIFFTKDDAERYRNEIAEKYEKVGYTRDTESMLSCKGRQNIYMNIRDGVIKGFNQSQIQEKILQYRDQIATDGEIKEGSTVVLNDKIVSYIHDTEIFRPQFAQLALQWYKEEVEFIVFNRVMTPSGEWYCNLEGFAVPERCLKLADMQK